MSVKLLPKQHRFVYSKTAITVYYAGRGGGKSFAASYLVSNKLTHGRNVLGIAPTYKVLNSVLVKGTLEILRKHGWRPYYNKQEGLLILRSKGRELARAYFRSAENPEMIRGLTDIHDMVMDEAALCPKMAFDLAIACLRGQSIRDPQSYLITTPRGRANWTADLYLDPDSTAVHSTIDENTMIDTESFKNMLLKQYGEDFAEQEIYAKLLDSTEAGLFKARHLEMLRTPRVHVPGPVVFGFDVAGSGKDSSAITVLSGNRILEIAKRKTPDDQSLVGFYAEMHHKHNPSLVNVDSTGLGQFLPSRLQPLFPATTFVPVHFASKIKPGYKNARTQIYFDLKKAIENGLHLWPGVDIDLVKEIEKSLYATEYHIDGQSDFALQPKDKISEILGASPDAADSAAIATLDTGAISAATIAAGAQRLKQLSKKKNPLRR